jgi:hypothetical protein
MTSVWALAALWLGLALVASLLSIWFRVSTALSEIVVGTIAQLIIGAVIGQAVLGTDESWVKFLSGTGAIVLTFLAGAELDPAVFKLKWKEAAAVGLASFFFPFLGCAAAAYYVLGWEPMPSWLAGVAMSTTSVAVVYAVMLEFGFNRTELWKDGSRRVFRHRPWDGGGARSDFCAVHVQDPRVSRRRRGRIFHPSLADAALFQVVWKPTLGTRNQVPAVVPVRNGRTCELGRQ